MVSIAAAFMVAACSSPILVGSPLVASLVVSLVASVVASLDTSLVASVDMLIS